MSEIRKLAAILVADIVGYSRLAGLLLAPPWGVLTALDRGSRKILWRAPLGTTEELNPLGLARHIGTPTFGGPLATASGLVFIGAALDDYLRAFDAKTGAELWTGRLPSAGIATPTSYLWQGRQYVLIAAGGHGEAGAPASDTPVAFVLPLLASQAPRPGCAGSTSRAAVSSCTPGWPEPWRLR
jgi:quinoprotein glucose dehydrogenase